LPLKTRGYQICDSGLAVAYKSVIY